MRLKKSRNAADEHLIDLSNEGYKLLTFLRADHVAKKSSGTYDSVVDHQRYVNLVNDWGGRVQSSLKSTFPTELEANKFLHPPLATGAIAADTQDDYKAASLRMRLDDLLRGLEAIRTESLPQYTDLPVSPRLYVEDIDSFRNVRDINPAAVADLVNRDGYINVSEDLVQRAFESILNESFHKKDWGGEYNDLYTSNLLVNGQRRATAFLLKGSGLTVKVMEIKHCGKNADQHIRLFESVADLFVIHFVGNISEALIKDVAGKTDLLRSQGKLANYCIINGLDTARILRAYGFA